MEQRPIKEDGLSLLRSYHVGRCPRSLWEADDILSFIE
jgi:hypothetical protein